jgi:hypothetical protein
MTLSRTKEIPEHIWIVRQLPGGNPDVVESRSIAAGVSGLALFFYSVAISTPILGKLILLSEIGPWLDQYLRLMSIEIALLQWFSFPIVLTFSYALVAFFFRRGSLVKRLVIAAISLAPGWITFCLLVRLAFGIAVNPNDFATVGKLVYAFAIGAGLTSIVFLLPWFFVRP